jgi:hypothetical protein
MTHVYIVRRESAEGLEIDCFTDYQLAQRWAATVDAEVEEESILDIDDILLMEESYRGEELEECDTCEALHHPDFLGHEEEEP